MGGARRGRPGPDEGPRRTRRRPLLAGLLVAPLLAAAWVVSLRRAEEALLVRAAAQLARREREAAGETLDRLARRRPLSGDAKRRAAGLYLRLGEDRAAHTLLVGQRFDEREDRRLRELSARARRAAALLAKASASKQPAERLRLTRAALGEVPESPRLLLRVVEEELLVIASSDDPEAREAFERDYAELRRTAPRLAAELKQRVAELLSAGK